jgi:addiction module RelE/StbE family toxin
LKVRWSEQAEGDLGDIVAYIWLDNPAAAYRIGDLLEAATGKLADFPRSGRQGEVSGTRELLPHPSYRIVYEIDGEEIIVLAVVHTARQWPPLGEAG